MANNLLSNPITIDTAASSTVTNKRVQLIQWIDSAGDAADTNSLDLTFNGANITAAVQIAAATTPVTLWEASLDKSILATITVNTIEAGTVLIWTD